MSSANRPVREGVVRQGKFADVYRKAGMNVVRLHTCPKCGDPIGHGTDEPVNEHIEAHDPEDFPL